MTRPALPVVALISGNGSNLQAIIDAIKDCTLNAEIRAVISNNPSAYGLKRAQQTAIPTEVLQHTDFPDRECYDLALQTLIDQYQPKLIVLAGFMRILSETFVIHFEGRLINIHPSLLPKYKGLNTHKRALEAGDTVHGATVHFVTHELDGGPAILQAQVPIEPGDNTESLAKRVLSQEHKIYPLAIAWFAQHRIRWQNKQVYFDNRLITSPIQYNQFIAQQTNTKET